MPFFQHKKVQNKLTNDIMKVPLVYTHLSKKNFLMAKKIPKKFVESKVLREWWGGEENAVSKGLKEKVVGKVIDAVTSN